MKLQTIALILAVIVGGFWAVIMAAGILVAAWPFGWIAMIPVAALTYIVIRLIGEQVAGDPYDDIEE